MAVEKTSTGTNLVDVLDRVLDKGIIIDAWVRVSLVGIDLLSVEARIVVASIDTYLKYADAVGVTSPPSRISTGPGSDELRVENEELRERIRVLEAEVESSRESG